MPRFFVFNAKRGRQRFCSSFLGQSCICFGAKRGRRRFCSCRFWGKCICFGAKGQTKILLVSFLAVFLWEELEICDFVVVGAVGMISGGA